MQNQKIKNQNEGISSRFAGLHHFDVCPAPYHWFQWYAESRFCGDILNFELIFYGQSI